MLPVYSNLSVFGQVELGNAISVSTTGTLNNLANDNSSILRFTSASAVVVTGLIAPTNYKTLNIIHQGASTLTINHQNASSTASNRIITSDALSLVLNAGQIATLIYDPVASRWIVVSVSITSSGGGSSSGLSQTVNVAPVSLALGMPVYWDGTKYAPSRSNNITTIPSAIVSVLNGGDYTVQFGGTLTLTNAQWDAVTGQTGGLTITPSTNKYYGSDGITTGRHTVTAPPLAVQTMIGLTNSGGNSTAEIKFGVQSQESGMGDTKIYQTFTGTGAQTTFTLSTAPAGTAYTTVYIGGVYQIPTSSYTLSGADIIFSSAPANTAVISVEYFRSVQLADVNAVNRMVAFSETVSGSPKNTFNLATTPAGVNSVILFVGGSIQDTSQFTLSGNVLTTLSSVNVGVQVIAYVLNSSGISNAIDSFITRIAYSLGDTGVVSIATMFGNQTSGVYRFHDTTDPRINGVIGLKDGSPPDVSVDTSNTSITTTFGTASSLNWYLVGNVLTVQNLLGRTCLLKIFKEV